MKSHISMMWAVLVVVLLSQVSLNAVEVKVFSETSLSKAFESGSGLFIVEVISRRQDEVSKFFSYKVRVIDSIVLGDIHDSFSEPIEILAGSSYGDSLKVDGRYALFIKKEGRYCYSWTHRNDVIRIPEKSYYWPLVAKAEEVYNKSEIRAFRVSRKDGIVSMPELPGQIPTLCKEFRSRRRKRSDVGKKIYETDLGSRLDISKPESSFKVYQKPKIVLYRDQIKFLLGNPTLKSGWDYYWFCGEERGSEGADNHIGVLSARFDQSQKCIRLVYELNDHHKWKNPSFGRSGRQPPPEDVAVVIEAFQKALGNSDWEKALSLCSEKVNNKAKVSDSLEVFFKSVVPITEFISETDIKVRGRGSSGHEVSRYSFDIPVKFLETDEGLEWEWSVLKSGDIWVIDFKPKTLEIQLKHHRMQQESYQNRGDHAMRVEKMRKGIEISLIPLAEEFVIGKPMLFRVQMANVSDETLSFSQESWVVNDPMIVKDPDGNKVSYTDSSYQTWVGTEFIEPGETIVLVESYDVSSQYRITKPGKYSFQFTRFHLKRSNVVEVGVKAGELSPLDLATEKLKPIVPEKWEFSSKIISEKQFGGAKVGKCLTLSLVDLNSGKQWNAAILIKIFLDYDKSQLDYKSWFGEFWGDSRWGPVYVRSINATLLWPGYKSQLMKVLDIK